MLKPSLYALYKQGRFRKPGSETDEGMHQIERFAVAILAFALKHEPQFRKDFLQKVCESSESDNAEHFLIELEVAGCGDLVLRKVDNSEVYVLEFKVGALLQSHNQDPRNREFFTTGYGLGIKRNFGNNATYILVQNNRDDFSNAAEKIPICIGKSWHDIYLCSHEKPLIRDLFESFGLLNIPEFIHMNTKNISLGHGEATLQAVKLYKLLEAVAGHIGSSRRAKPDVDWDSKGGYIGMNFLPKDNFDEWQKLVQPQNDTVGWFGYCQYKESTLDVWFYTGTEEAAERIRKHLAQYFEMTKDVKVSIENKPYVWISLLAEKSKDNQDWFISVFELLVPRK